MHGYADHNSEWRAQGDEGNAMIPRDVLNAVEAVIACGKEVILRKEKGKWVVLENGRRLVYKEQDHHYKQ